MASINIHSASPISSMSSREEDSEDKTTISDVTVESSAALAATSDSYTGSGSALREENPSTDDLHGRQCNTTVSDSIVEDIAVMNDSVTQTSSNESTKQAPNDPGTPPTSTTAWTSNSPRRNVPRIHTRHSSIAASAELPWKIDNTSSTPTHTRRSSSIAPPPRAGEHVRSSSIPNGSTVTGSPLLSAAQQPFSYQANASPSPTPYAHSQNAQSPYSSNTIFSCSSPSYTSPRTPPHMHSLSHPPGYHQNTQAILSNNTTGGSDAAALYTSNTSPLYSNISNLPFPSLTNGVNSTGSPTRGRGRGILDNDPSIYLGDDGQGPDDGTMWDTATKWAMAAGKRLSTGDIGLWKLVGGEER